MEEILSLLKEQNLKIQSLEKELIEIKELLSTRRTYSSVSAYSGSSNENNEIMKSKIRDTTNGIHFGKYGKGGCIYGDTKEHKEIFKKEGAKWNSSLRAWIMTIDKCKELSKKYKVLYPEIVHTDILENIDDITEEDDIEN